MNQEEKKLNNERHFGPITQFSFSLSRATSRESVRSAVQPFFYASTAAAAAAQQEAASLRLPVVGSQLLPVMGGDPPGYSSGSGGGVWLRGEMLRQHSQPETSCYHCNNTTTSSLRQLKEMSVGSGSGGGCDIAGIAADTLRINGAIRQFRQVAFPVGQTIFFFLYAIFSS